MTNKSKKSAKCGLTVDTVKCSSKDKIFIHKGKQKPVKLSGKRYEASLDSFMKTGLSAEERLLCAIFGEKKAKGVPKEKRTKELHDAMYIETENMFKRHDEIERKFNNGRKFVVIGDKERKRIESLRKKGLSVKEIAKELHRSDHTVREQLNGSHNMSIDDMEKSLKKGVRPAPIAKVSKKR